MSLGLGVLTYKLGQQEGGDAFLPGPLFWGGELASTRQLLSLPEMLCPWHDLAPSLSPGGLFAKAKLPRNS